ncbi:MAG: hypothetical protein CMK59_13695 [Proteobacteria bacterium]|nr:hypothetical protein [Pseudomonadota bacterium]
MLFLLACVAKKSPPVPMAKEEFKEIVEPPTVMLNLADSNKDAQIKETVELSMVAEEEDLGIIADLNRDFQKFIVIEYGDDDDKNADLIVESKKDEMFALAKKAIAMIEAQKNYPEVSAAVYVAGASELHYIDMFLHYPIPTDLSALGRVIFQDRQLEFVEELEEGGRYRLDTLVQHALQRDIRGGWEEEAFKTLSYYYPLEYPTIHSTSTSHLDGVYAHLRLVERSSMWKEDIWPREDEDRMNMIEELKLIDQKSTAWMDSCHKIQKDLVILDPDSELYCLGRNYVDVLSFLYDHPKPTLSVEETIEVYVDSIEQLLETFPLDESGLFWKKELQRKYRMEQRENELAKRLKGEEVLGDVKWIDPKWEYSDQTDTERHQEELIMLHQEVHAHRIQFHTEQLKKKLERGFSTHDFLVNQVPQQIKDLESQSEWILSFYPEVTESRDRIMMSLGALHKEYARALLKAIGHASDDDIFKILELQSKSELEGHRYLSHVASREGPSSKWSSKAALLLR